MTTLKQLSDYLGVDAADLTGDEELAEELMNEDITETLFYKDLLINNPEEMKGLTNA